MGQWGLPLAIPGALVPAPRTLFVASALSALSALLVSAPSLTAVSVAGSPNGPSLDHLFHLEAGPDLSRQSAAALAAAPSGADPAAFDFAALQAAQRMPIASANLRWKQIGPGGGIV